LTVGGLFPAAPAGITTLQTNPAGQFVSVDGIAVKTPVSYPWPGGEVHTVSVPFSQVSPDTGYQFRSWADNAQLGQPRQVTGIANTSQSFTANLQQLFFVNATVVPTGAGTVVGAGWYPPGGSAQLRATASSLFSFVNFTGDLTLANDTPFTVTGPVVLQANFAAKAQPALYAASLSRSAVNAQQLTLLNVVFRLTNNGPGPAGDAVITGLDGFTDIGGTGAQQIQVVSGLNVPAGTLGVGQSGTQTLLLSWPLTATRVQMKVHFSANGGSYTGVTTLNLIR